MLKMGSLYSFNVSGTRVLFNPVFTNIIYEISDSDKIEAKYSVNIEQKNVIKKMGKETTTHDYLNLLNTNNYYFFDGESVSTDNFLYFNIQHGGDCYYSKKTGKLFYGRSVRLNANTTNILSINKPITSKDNFFVSIILPYRLLEILPARKLNEDLKRLVTNLKEEDNPILFFYSLKSL